MCVAHHSDDGGAAHNHGLIQRRCVIQGIDLAGAILLEDVVRVLFASHQRQPEVQAFLPGDLKRDITHPVHAVVAPAHATGSDDQGDVEPVPSLEKKAQVALGALAGKMRLPAPQMRSEEHTSELQSLMRISYADFCLETKT